jgi:hypothetical protein
MMPKVKAFGLGLNPFNCCCRKGVFFGLFGFSSGFSIITGEKVLERWIKWKKEEKTDIGNNRKTRILVQGTLRMDTPDIIEGTEELSVVIATIIEEMRLNIAKEKNIAKGLGKEALNRKNL